MASISTLVDRVKIIVQSSGTGPFELGPAVPAFRGVEALIDGATYSYATENGARYEAGTGVYNSSLGLLVRTPIVSSNGGAAVSFPANVELAFTALAQDLLATGGTLPIVDALGDDSGVAISQRAATNGIAAKAEAAVIGVSGDASTLGTFTGSIIPDNQTVKQAIQVLETAQEAFPVAPVFGKVSVNGKSRFQNIGENPNSGWPSTDSPSSNIFSYLDDGGAVSGGQPLSNIAFSGYARTSDTFGTASEVAIGVAGFAYNDKIWEGAVGPNGNGVAPASTAGAWAGYLTAFRAAGVSGATHGLEIDIANAGATVPIFPAQINGSAGLTNGLQLAAGGEGTATPGLVKTASSAISILSNDPNNVANFEKGIVFHRYALAGTDGSSGNGIAIAFSTGHNLSWFDVSNNQVGSVSAEPSATASSWTKLLFNAGGFVITKGLDNGVLFQVDPVVSAQAYMAIVPQGAGGAPHLVSRGNAADIDLYLEPKGSGVAGVTYGFSATVSPGTFSATRMLAFKDGTGATFYIPAATAGW